MEDVVNDLADSDVTIIDETDVLLVLDQYSDGKSWVVEVWGPYTNDQFQFKQLLPLIKSHIKHFPAKLVFFYNGKNLKLTNWLKEQDALFSQQTIWQMCPFQAMNSNIRIEIHTFSIENKKRRELLALHQRMFSGNKINIVRKNHPLFLGYLNEQLCAYASAQLSQKEGRLLYLGVDEEYRQQGIATALMAQVWNFLHDSCQDKITLVQSDKAQAAGKLYKKLGFKTIRRLLSAQLIVN